MPRSIKVQASYSDTLRIAIKRNGFPTQRALAERAGYSLATVKKFLGCKPVDFATFTELCETLNLDWEEIADLGTDVPPAPRKSPEAASPPQETVPPGENSAATSPPSSPATAAQASKQPPALSCAQDWGAAVDVSIFHGRQPALETLEAWIVQDKCRLVALGGIG
ncbi:MAG: helix-turn-helix domain-containing protein, partial [Cyanobacteria bacterium J06598_3]